MKVYVVISSSYDDYEMKGVYTSWKQAKEQIDIAFSKYVNTDKYEYILRNNEHRYHIYRYKTYEFNDGLVDGIYCETYDINEVDITYDDNSFISEL